MYLNDARRIQIKAAITTIVDRVPDDVWVELDLDEIQFQAATNAECKARRQLFPGVVWAKEFSESCGWWNYRATWEGIAIKIYACTENPPTCRTITEEYEAEERVPIITGYETRMVTHKRTRVECGPEA